MSHQLTVHNPYVRRTKQILRFPVLNDGVRTNDIGGSISRYLAKLGPGQMRFFCHPMTAEQKARYLERGGLPGVKYDGSKPMSISHINKLFKKGADMLGLEVSYLLTTRKI